MTKSNKEYHRQYMADLRQWRREHHVCVVCGEEDARTMIGKSTCFDCYEREHNRKMALKCTDRYTDQLERNLAGKHKTQSERIENGLCIVCGKRKTEDGYKMCSFCRSKNRARHTTESKVGVPRDELYIYGRCHKCLYPLDGAVKEDGTPSKLCKRCYEHTVKSAKMASLARKKLPPNPPIYKTENAIETYNKLMEDYKKRESDNA